MERPLLLQIGRMVTFLLVDAVRAQIDAEQLKRGKETQMKKLLLLLTIASFPSLVEAQSTSVTLQATDAGAQTWNNGSWSALLVSQIGASQYGPPFNIIGGGSVPNQSQSGSLSATGGASLTVTPNVSIAPAQSQWQFKGFPGHGVRFQWFSQSVDVVRSSPN